MTVSVHLVCPHCNVVNRTPQKKLGDNPNCGSCHQPLFTNEPVKLDDMSVHKFTQKNDVLTVVDFWASWCQPCLMMAPQFAQAASQLPQVVFAKLQTDKFEQSAARYHVRSLPTMVAFKSGKEVARQSGAMPAGQIVAWVSRLITR